tara:strand:+ start:9398 stop:13519 length:4122 start_codon:yes stop_codon:yes gene_type:complete
MAADLTREQAVAKALRLQGYNSGSSSMLDLPGNLRDFGQSTFDGMRYLKNNFDWMAPLGTAAAVHGFPQLYGMGAETANRLAQSPGPGLNTQYSPVTGQPLGQQFQTTPFPPQARPQGLSDGFLESAENIARGTAIGGLTGQGLDLAGQYADYRGADPMAQTLTEMGMPVPGPGKLASLSGVAKAAPFAKGALAAGMVAGAGALGDALNAIPDLARTSPDWLQAMIGPLIHGTRQSKLRPGDLGYRGPIDIMPDGNNAMPGDIVDGAAQAAPNNSPLGIVPETGRAGFDPAKMADEGAEGFGGYLVDPMQGDMAASYAGRQGHLVAMNVDTEEAEVLQLGSSMADQSDFVIERLRELGVPTDRLTSMAEPTYFQSNRDRLAGIMPGRAEATGKDAYDWLVENYGSQRDASAALSRTGIVAGQADNLFMKPDGTGPSYGTTTIAFDPSSARVDPRYNNEAAMRRLVGNDVMDNVGPHIPVQGPLGSVPGAPAAPIIPVNKDTVRNADRIPGKFGDKVRAATPWEGEIRQTDLGFHMDAETGADLTGQTLAPGASINAKTKSFKGVVDDTFASAKPPRGQGSLSRVNLIRPTKYEYIGADGVPRTLKHSISSISSSSMTKGNPTRNAKGDGYNHAYANEIEYRVPAKLGRENKGAPNLRPESYGDIYGINPSGKIKLNNGNVHPLYDKIVVVPKGSGPPDDIPWTKGKTTPRKKVKGKWVKAKTAKDKPPKIAPLSGDKAPKPSRAYTEVVPSIRHMSRPQAQAAVASMPHLVQRKNGTYVGAPDHIKDDAGLQKMRDGFDAAVAMGIRTKAGPDWYPSMGRNFSELAPGREMQMADEFAMTSPQATPPVNLGFALQGHNSNELGAPRSLVHTGAIARQMDNYHKTGDPGLSLKTGPFSQATDPTRPPTIGGTHDIWDARSWGYTKNGKPWDEGLSKEQHRFLDYETAMAVQRANEKMLGGRNDWNADSIQASAWVSAGGMDPARLKASGGDPIASMLSMGETDEIFSPHAVRLNQEAVTSTSDLGHLPDVHRGSQGVRNLFSSDSRQWGVDPVTGENILARAAGFWQQPTRNAMGLFTNKANNITETNPLKESRVLGALDKNTPYGSSGLAAQDREALTRIVALQGGIDHQDAAAGNIFYPVGERGTKVSEANALRIPHGGLSPAQTVQLKEATDAQGLNTEWPYATITGSEDTIVANVDYPDPDTVTKSKLAAINKQTQEELKGLSDELKKRGLPSEVERGRAETIYVSFGEANKTPNQGKVVQILFDLFEGDGSQASYDSGQFLLDKLDADPRIREYLARKIESNTEWGKLMGGERQDQKNFLELWRDKGLRKVFEALKDGSTILPALFLPLLVPAISDMLDEQSGDMPQAA